MSSPLFQRVLIANRGEIALRVIRTAREMGIESVAVYSDADRNALHVRRADRAVRIGGPTPAESYLRVDAVLAAAREVGADCIHPGYGFLSENAGFSEACAEAGITFLGPSADAIRQMGDKVEARRVADEAGVPLVPGLKDDVRDDAVLIEKAAEIGYPVMLKAAAGGGGKGIRIVHAEKDLLAAASMARAEARGAFGDDRVYLEKFVTKPRHVEVQIVADKDGGVTAYGERECSVQRRHQKLVEESPCVALTPELRAEMCEAACRLARAVDYVGAGTVEFLYSEGAFYFLEMNTRLQVEHPITEERFGVDLVREQFRVAAGLPVAPAPEPRGHSIEVRVNAEDPENFFPSLGRIRRLGVPGGQGVRLDSALFRGLEVTPYYDSMLAKLVVHADDRDTAIARAIRAIREFRIVGVTTSMPIAMRALDSAEFRSGDYDTGILERIDRRPSDKVLELAALAAAVGKFLATEEIPVASSGAASRPPISAWNLVDRAERLGRGAR
jgi:acetyl-CoA carboxylase biotin carboxylase subunit